MARRGVCVASSHLLYISYLSTPSLLHNFPLFSLVVICTTTSGWCELEVGNALGDEAIARGLPEVDPGQILAHDGAGLLVDVGAFGRVHLLAASFQQLVQISTAIFVIIGR